MTCKHGIENACCYCELEYMKKLLGLAQEVIDATRPFCDGIAIDVLRAGGFPVSEFSPVLSSRKKIYVLATEKKNEIKKPRTPTVAIHIKNCGCKCHTDKGPICMPCAAIAEETP